MTTNIHIVASALVGGGTGKSTFIQMFTGYLAKLEEKENTVVVVDASNNATMYAQMERIIHPSDDSSIAGYDTVKTIHPTLNKQLYVVRPNPGEETKEDKVIEIIVKVQKHIKDKGGKIDHLICETNFPNYAVHNISFLDKLRINQHTKIFIWTTWNIRGLNRPEVYSNIHSTSQRARRNNHIFWYFVHNPFAVDANPGDFGDSPQANNIISPTMQHCLIELLDKAKTDYSILDMKRYCGEPAFKASVEKAPAEEIFKAAYKHFRESNERPRNLLPVFMSSETWRRAFRIDFENSRNLIVTTPIKLAETLDKLSDGLYSSVFETYFNTIRHQW